MAVLGTWKDQLNRVVLVLARVAHPIFRCVVKSIWAVNVELNFPQLNFDSVAIKTFSLETYDLFSKVLL